MAGRTDSGSSITNVAATAGVSIATVSRVLSGKRGKDDDIARRVREAGVYSELVPHSMPVDEILAKDPKAIILSGGPASVFEPGAPTIDTKVFESGVPVLGICYGFQVMAYELGGKVDKAALGEYGKTSATIDDAAGILADSPAEQTTWMSHGVAVEQAPAGFEVLAHTEGAPVAAMADESRKLYGVQWHPEVKHSPLGQKLIENFLHRCAALPNDWDASSIIEDQVKKIREQVGDAEVICGLSGGVDSAVAAALVHKAIGDQLTCVFVDHGLLRKGEPEQVEEVFTKQFDVVFIHVHAEDRYAELLAGVTEPEEKRRIIGTQFWKEFFAVAQQLETDGKPVKYLAQGTIYPDIIESGARKTGGKASTIKSHHNLIPFPEGVHFDLIEPLDHFFKDEVRALGLALGLPGHIVFRQPFPGPGLAIRIIGAVDKEKLEILKNADAIVREELDAYNQRLFEQTGERNSEHSCWQYFAVLPDIKSVGVMGDERTYQRPIILRAVESSDAMTADWAKLPYDVLARISGRIVAEVPGANRVCYDITSKPPATIEWE